LDESQSPHLLEFGKPAVYRIAVQGQLDQCVVTDIADARIEAGDPHTTRLLVRVLDQAGLSGVLDALHGLHLPLLSVHLVNHAVETNGH